LTSQKKQAHCMRACIGYERTDDGSEMSITRSHAFVLLAVLSLLAAACGELQQQAAEPSAVDRTSMIAEDTATPPAATATAAPEPSETPKAVEPTAAPPTAVPTPAPNRPEALSLAPGEVARGGNAYRYGKFTFVIPAGYDLISRVTLSDPGGLRLFVLIHEPTQSVLRIDPETGKENGRAQYSGAPLTDPAMNSVFDSIVTSIVVDQ
jgi:hypothetical protein